MTTDKARIVFFDLDGVIFRGQSQQLLLRLARINVGINPRSFSR